MPLCAQKCHVLCPGQHREEILPLRKQLLSLTPLWSEWMSGHYHPGPYVTNLVHWPTLFIILQMSTTQCLNGTGSYLGRAVPVSPPFSTPLFLQERVPGKWAHVAPAFTCMTIWPQRGGNGRFGFVWRCDSKGQFTVHILSLVIYRVSCAKINVSGCHQLHTGKDSVLCYITFNPGSEFQEKFQLIQINPFYFSVFFFLFKLYIVFPPDRQLVSWYCACLW